MGENEAEYDRVTQASLKGLYVKARELDRDHNWEDAPDMRPPGTTGCTSGPRLEADCIAHASDATTHASDATARASDATSHASDATAHASPSASA